MPWPKGKPRGTSPFKGKHRSPYARRSPCTATRSEEGNPRPAMPTVTFCRDCGSEGLGRCPTCGGTARERVPARSPLCGE